MKDQNKTKAQLIDELKFLRKSLAAQHEQGNTFKREVQKVKGQKNQLDVQNKQLQIDLSKCQNTQQALLESKKRVDAQLFELGHLYNVSPVGLCLTDRELRFVRINEHLARINGKAASEHIGRTLNEVLPQIVAQVEPIYRRVIDSGQPELDFEVHSVTPAEPEKPKDWLVSFFPLKSNDGTIQGVSTVVREITERKRIEQSLKESEEKFRTICEYAPVMIDAFDDNGTCSLWNRECERVLGWSQEEIRAHDDPLSLAYPDLEKRNKVLETIKTADGDFREWEVLAKDGSTRIQMWADFRLPDNSAISIGYDIMERKRMEERLKFFMDAINSSSDCFILADPERNITYVNSAATDLFGYTQEEFLGMHVSCLDADSSDADKIIAAVMKKGEWHGEIIEKRKDGSLFDCNLRASIIRNEKDKAIGLMGILRDITERKQAEAKIAASLKEKEVLLREVQHRVKNNLQMVSSLFDLQAQYSKDEKTIEACMRCQSRVKTIALIHEKLYQSKDFTKISFNEYIQNLTGHLFQLSGIKSDAIQLKLNVDDVTLDISSTIHLGLIINELVSNALEYAFPESKVGEILIGFRKVANNKYTLIVSDNGVGLPKELDIRNTESLGLQLVRVFAEQLDGKIELDKRGGTTFKITLNIVE